MHIFVRCPRILNPSLALGLVGYRIVEWDAETGAQIAFDTVDPRVDIRVGKIDDAEAIGIQLPSQCLFLVGKARKVFTVKDRRFDQRHTGKKRCRFRIGKGSHICHSKLPFCIAADLPTGRSNHRYLNISFLRISSNLVSVS